MNAPIRALLWEQWRRTRWALLTVFAASTLVSVYCLVSPHFPKDYQASAPLSRDFRSFAMILYLLALFLPLDGSDVKLGLPRYMMTLPRATSTLAEVLLGYGLSSVFLLALANEAVAAIVLGDSMWELAPFMASLAAVLYALFWTFGVVAPRPALFAAATIAVTLVYFHNIFAGAWAFLLLPEIVMAILGVSLAVWGIRRDRHGEIAPGYFERREGLQLADVWRMRWLTTLFETPGLKAQFVYEWKRTYRYIPMLSAPAALLWCIALPTVEFQPGLVFYHLDQSRLFNQLAFGIIPMLPLLCGIIGLLRDTWEYRAYRDGTGSPDYCHPVSDRTLVIARWLAGAAGIGLAEILLCGILQIAALLLFEHSWRTSVGQLLMAATAIGIAVLAHMTVCWILLWLSPLVLLAALVILGSLPHGVALLSLSLIVALGLFWMVPVAIKRKAISARWVFFSLLFWAIVQVVIRGGMNGLTNLGLNDLSLASGLLAIVVCLTFVWTPLTVHTMRHRR